MNIKTMLLPMIVMSTILLSSKHANGAPIDDLSNFQGHFECDRKNTLLSLPKRLADLAGVVEQHSRVQAVGAGHSWNNRFFCAAIAPDGSPGVNVAMTSMVTDDQGNVDLTKEIIVDEEEKTVIVSAGVMQRDLIDYLASYGVDEGGSGYTLPAHSWYIDQTMGGAIATDTHGSSTTYGTLSGEDQLLDLWMMLGNGTVIHLSDEINPHLMKAARVSVGRLGIILYMKMRLIPQTEMIRKSEFLPRSTVVEELLMLQQEYIETGKVPEVLDRLQLFWYPNEDSLIRVSVEESVESDFSAPQDSPFASIESSKAMELIQKLEEEIIPEDSLITIPPPALPVRASGLTFGMKGPAGRLIRILFSRAELESGTYPSRKGIISYNAPEGQLQFAIGYDQYELAVPLKTAGTCFDGLTKWVQENNAGNALISPPLIRFVSETESYLGLTNGGPLMYINIEDYLFYNDNRGRRDNVLFQEVIDYVRNSEDCGGVAGSRLHWGKAGFPDDACVDGSVEYGINWCHFGCAVRTLDPNNMFQSDSSVFRWNVTALDMCCGDEGFMIEKEGCGSCAGFEPELLYSASASSMLKSQEDVAQCELPQTHPKFKNPNLWNQ